jgi:hypothetical protein
LAEAVDLRPECAPGPVDSPFAAESLLTCQPQRRRHTGSIGGPREVEIVYLSETLCRGKVGSKKRKRNDQGGSNEDIYIRIIRDNWERKRATRS